MPDYKFKEINLQGITDTKGTLAAWLSGVAQRTKAIAESRGHQDVRVTLETRPKAGLVAVVGTYTDPPLVGVRREAKTGGLVAGAAAVGKLRGG